MKTENEIKALPLEEKQKLVIELRAVKPGDKAYPNAKAVIELITSDKKWKEPELIEVENVAGHEVSVDGSVIAADATGKVFPWQLNALARFLQRVEKESALIVFAFLLAFGFTASAQTQTTLIGGPGQYWVRTIAGLNGGTNYVATNVVNSYITPVTNSVITTNANWINQGGIWTNSPTLTTNSTVTVPGIVSLTGYDQFTLTFGGSLLASGAAGTSVATVDYSADMLIWQTNKWSLALTPIGAEVTSTNLDVTGVNGGFIRLNNTKGLVAAGLSNTVFEVSVKPSAHGP